MKITAVTARFFAAAEEAVGAGEMRLELARPASIGDVLAAASGHESHAVLARCSFLVNGQATTDAAAELRDGDLLDVLPPFAGG